MRYFLTIEYNGTFFEGWQRQGHTKNTIQEQIEIAIQKLTKEKVVITGSGRTDSGVHATCQVAHFDLKKEWNPEQIKSGLNFYLENISIIDVKICNLHARFDAVYRSYQYIILNRRSYSPLLKNRAWHVPVPLDIKEIEKGLKLLEGVHDFKQFRSIKCQAKNSYRKLDKAYIENISNDVIKFNFQAKAFLHHQIRMMIGTIVRLGHFKITLDDLRLMLENKKNAGPNAPPYGLYFIESKYNF